MMAVRSMVEPASIAICDGSNTTFSVSDIGLAVVTGGTANAAVGLREAGVSGVSDGALAAGSGLSSPPPVTATIPATAPAVMNKAITARTRGFRCLPALPGRLITCLRST